MKRHMQRSTKELFEKLRHINDQQNEVELAEAEIEHKKPINVGFLSLQYVRLRMLELSGIFFTKVCDTDEYEWVQMDTDSFYSKLAGNELHDCVRSEKRQEWELLRKIDCNDSFTADAWSNFPRACWAKHKQQDKKA